VQTNAGKLDGRLNRLFVMCSSFCQTGPLDEAIDYPRQIRLRCGIFATVSSGIGTVKFALAEGGSICPGQM